MMNMRLILSTVLSVIIIGCSSTFELQKMPSDEFMEEFNAFSPNKSAEIIEITGTRFNVKNVRISLDSVYWTDLQDNSIMGSEKRRISRIKFSNSAKGALEGLGIGSLVGFSLGATLGLASGGTAIVSSGYVALVSGVALGALGGIPGLVVGAASGHKDTFVLNDPQDYFRLKNARIIEETDDVIGVKWKDRTFYLNKSEVIVEQKDGDAILYVFKEELTQRWNEAVDENQ